MERRPAPIPAPAAVLCAATLMFCAVPAAATPAATPAAATPASGCEDPILSAPDLRICRTVDRSGRTAMVLTNLDDLGNLLVPAADPDPWRPDRVQPPPAPGDPAESVPASGPDPADRKADGPEDGAEVRVVVRGGGGERDATDSEIEVTGDGRGGTTIVINIEAPAAPAPAPVVTLPVLAVGGLPGPFRYPDRQFFLGRGPGIASPGWLGGLGLNASNGFGLGVSRPCRDGYDCLMAPQVPRP